MLRGDRACASGAQGRRFDSYQAHHLRGPEPAPPTRGRSVNGGNPVSPVGPLAGLTRVPRRKCSVGIERAPPERKVVGSIPTRRTTFAAPSRLRRLGAARLTGETRFPPLAPSLG